MRAALAILLVAHAAAASAALCDVKEYAQLKDNAKSKFGRELLAIEYCGNHTKWQAAMQYQQLRDAEACRRANDLIGDALSASKGSKELRFALDGCPQTAAKGAQPGATPRK